MCGICGFFSLQRPIGEARSILERMTKTLRHRGPDDLGIWWNEENRVGLGHCRLSIHDLSKAGHQPMVSSSGRFYLSFNGEIFNFQVLRLELEKSGCRFLGHSDTEVLLEAIDHWGLKEALSRFNGMFAFALWDMREKVLHLVRDRIGEKPLYYGWVHETFLFGSELKAFRAHPDFKAVINRDALTLYLRHSYIPEPYSIFEGIQKLPPGSLLTVPLEKGAKTVKPFVYWSGQSVAESGMADPFPGTEKEARLSLEILLQEAVRLRMTADVPLGILLSGGIDSSLIAAIMQSLSPRPIRTFSVGFQETEYNEAGFARRVADHLKTDHTEICVSSREAMAMIPKLPRLYDEPFADASQIPTFLISEAARRDVTVTLSGDGGDELFGGYSRYLKWSFLWKTMDRLARPLSDRLYRRSLSVWKEPEKILEGDKKRGADFSAGDFFGDGREVVSRKMLADLIDYLPNDVLTKVDRASMGVGLEMRIPFLDSQVVAFAWRLPLPMKIRRGKGKWLLRQILAKHLPFPLFDRPKMGFDLPIGTWMKGPLRGWADSLLEERRLKKEGFFDPAPIRRRWLEHLSRGKNYGPSLWNILMFQAWAEEWGFSAKE